MEDLLGALTELETKYAPPRVNIAGPMVRPLPHPRVAIVGTRNPSPEGMRDAAALARSLAERGAIVVSGLARGIDTIAHTNAIAAGGQTIAVLGTPLSQTSPFSNTALQATIMREHLAISQFPEGQTVQPSNFVIRNRTMALIADASVIVESKEGGGSLHQGWEALRLGRPLFIHPREFAKPELEWPKKMMSYGAVQLTDVDDIMEAVPTAGFGLAAAALDSG
ncbi:MAG: DNA-processing protein DprA [Thermoplasmata archaeon]